VILGLKTGYPKFFLGLLEFVNTNCFILKQAMTVSFHTVSDSSFSGTYNSTL
jgi:hypothetical protein